MAEAIEVGLTGTATTAVKEINTAKVMKSGSLPVFATPAMCALMEEAAQETIKPLMAAALTLKSKRLTVTWLSGKERIPDLLLTTKNL